MERVLPVRVNGAQEYQIPGIKLKEQKSIFMSASVHYLCYPEQKGRFLIQDLHFISRGSRMPRMLTKAPERPNHLLSF